MKGRVLVYLSQTLKRAVVSFIRLGSVKPSFTHIEGCLYLINFVFEANSIVWR